jgi:hypothetical protein
MRSSCCRCFFSARCLDMVLYPIPSGVLWHNSTTDAHPPSPPPTHPPTHPRTASCTSYTVTILPSVSPSLLLIPSLPSLLSSDNPRASRRRTRHRSRPVSRHLDRRVSLPANRHCSRVDCLLRSLRDGRDVSRPANPRSSPRRNRRGVCWCSLPSILHSDIFSLSPLTLFCLLSHLLISSFSMCFVDVINYTIVLPGILPSSHRRSQLPSRHCCRASSPHRSL